jgi:hypothetical protein
VIALVRAAPRDDAMLLDGEVGSNGLWQARAGVSKRRYPQDPRKKT